MFVEEREFDSLSQALKELEKGFDHFQGRENKESTEDILEILIEVAERMKDNYPYHHPMYAGQMLKPPHPVARLAYTLALWLNPNNHALDGGRASSAMEKEAVAELAHMFGWVEHLGHLCSGGTMANMEALWISSQIQPGKILASSQAHYTHSRLSEVLKLDFSPVPVDSLAKMDPKALEDILVTGHVGTVVVTLGTTGFGSLDPLPEILELKKQYGFRIHVDAAYGGYFRLVDNLDCKGQKIFDCLDQVDSLVVDPHKHGLQPYGCGCVLFPDPSVGQLYKHDSPYTYFTSGSLHLGEISLECSRPGASAVALWATMRLLPLAKSGKFARNLAKGRRAALYLFEHLKNNSRYLTIFPPELDIIVFAPQAIQASTISEYSKRFFERAAELDLHLALIELHCELVKEYWPHVNFDQTTVTCLRSCLMKPEHFEWIEKIIQILDRIEFED